LTLYNILQLASIPALAPILLFLGATNGYYRQIAAQRLGLDLTSRSKYGNAPCSPNVVFSKCAQKRPWIHALSLGEVNAAAAFIRGMENAFSQSGLILSATTRSGSERLGQLFPYHQIIFPPFDFRISVKRFMACYQPSCLVIVETDIWPNWIWTFKEAGVPVFLINGSISSKASSRLKFFPYLARLLYDGFEAISMQSEADKVRLIELGIEPDRVYALGNLKFDSDVNPLSLEEKRIFFARTAINPKVPLWIAGSTHEGEEADVFKVHKRLKELFSEIKLLIAPRHIQRVEEILKLAKSYGLSTQRLSHCRGEGGADVTIVDEMGKLASLYGVANAAFVGGSLVPVGGHNLLEPAQHGIPVLFGPFVESCEEVSHGLLLSNGGVLVENDDMLFERLASFFSDRMLRKDIGRNAMEFAMRNKGVISRHIDWLKGHMTI